MDKQTKKKPPEDPSSMGSTEGPTKHKGSRIIEATGRTPQEGTYALTTKACIQIDRGHTTKPARQLPQAGSIQTKAAYTGPPLKQTTLLIQPKIVESSKKEFQKSVKTKPRSSDADNIQDTIDEFSKNTNTTDNDNPRETRVGTRTRANRSMTGQWSETTQTSLKLGTKKLKPYMKQLTGQFEQSTDQQKTDVSHGAVVKPEDGRAHAITHNTEGHYTAHREDEEVSISKQGASPLKKKSDKPHDTVGRQGDRTEHQETEDNDGQSSVLTVDQVRTSKQDKPEGTGTHTDESPDAKNLERQHSGHTRTRDDKDTTPKQDKPKVVHSMDESPDAHNLERQPSGHTRTKDDKVTNPKQATDICAPMREGINKQQHQRNPDTPEPLKPSVKQTKDPTSEPSVLQETASDTNADIDKGTGEVVGNAECDDGDDKGTHASNDPVTDENEDSDSSWDKLDEDKEGNLALTTDKSGAVSIQPPVIAMVTESESGSSTNDSKPNKIGSIANAKVIRMTIASIWILVVNDKKMSLRSGIKEARCENGFLVLDDNELYEIDLVNGDIVLKPIKKQMESETSKDTANIVSVKESNIEPSVRTSNEGKNKTIDYSNKTEDTDSNDLSEPLKISNLNEEIGINPERKHLKKTEPLKVRSQISSKDAAICTEYDNENKIKAMVKDVYYEDGSQNSMPQDAVAGLTDMFSKTTINDNKDERETDQDYFQKNQSEKLSKTDRFQERNEDTKGNTSKVTAHGTYNVNESTSDYKYPQSTPENNPTENLNQSTNDTNQPSVNDTNEITTRSGIRTKKYNEEEKEQIMTDDPHQERQSGNTPPLSPKSQEQKKTQGPIQEPSDAPSRPPRKRDDKPTTSQPDMLPDHEPPKVFTGAIGDPSTELKSSGQCYTSSKPIISDQDQPTPGLVQPVDSGGAFSGPNRGASHPISMDESNKREMKVQIHYKNGKEMEDIERDLETYMKLKFILNNHNWMCEKRKKLKLKYKSMDIEYQTPTGILVIHLEGVNKPPGLQQSVVDDVITILLEKTDHLRLNSVPIMGIDKIEIKEIINEHTLVEDKDLYVECDRDRAFLHCVCPIDVRENVEVVIQSSCKILSGETKRFSLDMLYKDIFIKNDTLEKIRVEKRLLKVSLHDESDDTFVCVLRGLSTDVIWAEKFINKEVVEGYGYSVLAFKDIRYNEKFESSDLSEVVEECLAIESHKVYKSRFNRNNTISIYGEKQADVDDYVNDLKKILKMKIIESNVSLAQLQSYIKEIKASINKVIFEVLGAEPYKVKILGNERNVKQAEEMLLSKTNSKQKTIAVAQSKVSEITVTKQEKEVGKGNETKTCEKKTFWIKNHDIYRHICDKEELSQLKEKFKINKLTQNESTTSQGFCVTGGTHRYDELKEYLNQYGCEDIALTFKNSEKLAAMIHEIERKHNVTFKVKDIPGPVDRTEWDYPGHHRLMVINDDANNCSQDLMVDINIGEKQSSGEEKYVTIIGKQEEIERAKEALKRYTATGNFETMSTELNDPNDNCVICMDDVTYPVTLDCGHVFCKDCIEMQFKHKKACPTCGAVYGPITGDQPNGIMDVTTNHHLHLAGYRGCGSIVIRYDFPSGYQQNNHPSPGTYYNGIPKTAFLPDNHEGRQICEMLRVAFDRKLVFTMTTGQEGVITWNNIHHKTNNIPYSQFGYPDLTYLTRVRSELAAQGVKEKDIQKTFSKEHASSSKSKNSSTVGSDNCVICIDDVSDPVALVCGHVFCKECIEQQFKHKPACPICGTWCVTITGDQPNGIMDVTTNHHLHLAGYRGCGSIVIRYDFPSGYQQSNHPAPGKPYKGIQRTAYLPDNHEGRQICKMLTVAFDRKLVFTIGNSRTNGQEGAITWNNIHHKTDYRSSTQFGYPDPLYFDRVRDELAAKGVTEKDILKTLLKKHATSRTTGDPSPATDKQRVPTLPLTAAVEQTIQKGIEDDFVSDLATSLPRTGSSQTNPFASMVRHSKSCMRPTKPSLSPRKPKGIESPKKDLATSMRMRLRSSYSKVQAQNTSDKGNNKTSTTDNDDPEATSASTRTRNDKIVNNFITGEGSKIMQDSFISRVGKSDYVSQKRKPFLDAYKDQQKKDKPSTTSHRESLIDHCPPEVYRRVSGDPIPKLNLKGTGKSITSGEGQLTPCHAQRVVSEGACGGPNKGYIGQANKTQTQKSYKMRIHVSVHDSEDVASLCLSVCAFTTQNTFPQTTSYTEILGSFKTSKPDIQSNFGSEMIGLNKTTNSVVQCASSSDMLDSIKTTHSFVHGTTDSDMLGSIKTIHAVVQGASGSDLIGSIKTTHTVVQGTTDSDLLGSITTTQPVALNTSDSSVISDDEENIHLDTFEVVIRCKKRSGGFSTLMLKAQNTEEALKWRYIFSNNQHHRVTQKLQNVCKLINFRMDSNVAEIECEHNKPTVIKESLNTIVTQETIDLRVTDFRIELAECQRVVDILTRNCPVFSDQTVSLFMESARCYLVSPAHVFEANIEIFQQTRDFFSTTLGSQASKRK